MSKGRVHPFSLRRGLYSPFLAQLVTIRRCNLSCGYCSEYDDFSPPVPYEALVERIDHLQRIGAFAVELTGGEPMLHPRIYDVIEHCRHRDFRKVMMISNAYLFNEERVRRLGAAGLQELQISIDGVQPNEVTKKVLAPLRPKLEAVARAATFKVVLNSVIGSATPAQVLEVIDFAIQHGFVPRVQLIHGPDGQLELSQQDAALLDDVRVRLGKRFLEGGDYRLRLIRDGRAPFKCRAGSRYLYVDEHGYVRWCSQTRTTWGVPLADYSLAELRRQFHAGKACNESCTLGCVRNCSQHEQWRPQRRPAPVVAPS